MSCASEFALAEKKPAGFFALSNSSRTFAYMCVTFALATLLLSSIENEP
jgi:hypothetical protein